MSLTPFPSRGIPPVERDLSWLSWLPLPDKAKQQPKTQFKLQTQRSWTNFHKEGFGDFLSLDISEPFLFFYNSFGMYWLSKITTWESFGHGNERQEQFTISLTNLLNMFLWQILIFSTVYLCYRLKTLVVCHFRALALWMNHGNKKNFVNYHLCQYCFSSKDRSMWFRC